MTCNTCSFSWISGLLLFSSDFREDLRKWFLSMETALYRYRFLLGSSEAKVGRVLVFISSFFFFLFSCSLIVCYAFELAESTDGRV